MMCQTPSTINKMPIKTFAFAIQTQTVLTVNVDWALLLVPILRISLFNIRPRKDMKAIFDKIQFFTIILFNISEKPTKIFWFLN